MYFVMFSPPPGHFWDLGRRIWAFATTRAVSFRRSSAQFAAKRSRVLRSASTRLVRHHGFCSDLVLPACIIAKAKG